MRILITGASGLLGLNLALEAARAFPSQESSEPTGNMVIGVVNSHLLQTGAFQVMKADLMAPGEVERLLATTEPDWVINCAALALLDACEADPSRAEEMNVELPRRLANHVARGGARLVHISTDAVFDGKDGGYCETDTPNPLSVYARTKLAGEQAVLEAEPKAIVARVNLYGWSLSGKRSLAEWFFQNLSTGNPTPGFPDVYFCPLLANDLAHILLEMLQAGLCGLYHVVSSECLSKYDFGRRLARQFDFDESLVYPAQVDQAGLKAVRSPTLTLKNDKITQALGKPLPGIAPGLQKFHKMYLDGFPEYIRRLGK
jgi:dTDP-4-dehydrorhamnose reductase